MPNKPFEQDFADFETIFADFETIFADFETLLLFFYTYLVVIVTKAVMPGNRCGWGDNVASTCAMPLSSITGLTAETTA